MAARKSNIENITARTMRFETSRILNGVQYYDTSYIVERYGHAVAMVVPIPKPRRAKRKTK
jgi:antitoxin (DNA-binding transcriptional repressor) of toxin-antitoxin stability system